MAVTSYEYGEQNVLIFSATFTIQSTGALVDPTSVAFGYRVNGGSITKYVYGTDVALTRKSLGVYQVQIDTTNKPGTWVWEWQSTGTGQASVNGSLTVKQAPMTLL